MTEKLFIFICSLFLLSSASAFCVAQSARDGYIRTPDGVRLYYEEVSHER